MLPLLAIALVAGGGFVVYKIVSSPNSTSPATHANEWKNTFIIQRSFPPPPPFYAPTIKAAHYPLCWWSNPKTFKPVQYASAIDVRGEPWTATQMVYDGYERPKYPAPSDSVDLITIEQGVEFGFSGGQLWDVDSGRWVDVPTDFPRGYFASGTGYYVWVQASWSTGPDIGEVITDFVSNVVVPAMLTFGAGIIAPGVGGVIAGAALTAFWNVARGAKVTTAILDAAVTALPTALEHSAYADTYKKVISTYNQTKADLDAIRAEALKLYGYGKTNQEAVNKSVDTAIGLARSVQLQNAIIQAVRSRSADDAKGWMDKALDHGVSVQDWTIAMYGDNGGKLMQWAFDTANNALDNGMDPIAAVTPLVITYTATMAPKADPGKIAHAVLEGLTRT